jgi:hypothetical protein
MGVSSIFLPFFVPLRRSSIVGGQVRLSRGGLVAQVEPGAGIGRLNR